MQRVKQFMALRLHRARGVQSTANGSGSFISKLLCIPLRMLTCMRLFVYSVPVACFDWRLLYLPRGTCGTPASSLGGVAEGHGVQPKPYIPSVSDCKGRQRSCQRIPMSVCAHVRLRYAPSMCTWLCNRTDGRAVPRWHHSRGTRSFPSVC